LGKIRNTPADKLVITRLRVPDIKKYYLLGKSYLAVRLGLI
jgi:hypothetical protein